MTRVERKQSDDITAPVGGEISGAYPSHAGHVAD